MTTRAEVAHAVRHEGGVTVADVLLRRTGAGAAGHPGREAVAAAAAVLAVELGWDAARTARGGRRGGHLPAGVTSIARRRIPRDMDDLEALYTRHHADVRRFALFLTGDLARADDLAAETFVRAWTAR